MRIENLQNENRKYAKSIENFHVLEYVQDASVSPMNAMNEYFMSKMHVRRRQVIKQIKVKAERPGRGMSRCIPYNNIIFSIEVLNLFIK